MVSQEPFHTTITIREIGSLPSSTYGHASEIERLRFSPDGYLLASITEAANIVLIWDVRRKELIKRLSLNDASRIQDLTFSPDGTLLAISASGTVTLWNNTGEYCLERLPITAREIAFSPSGKELISLDSSGIVSFWDITKQQIISSFQAIPADSRCGWLATSTTLPCLALTNDMHKTFLWLFDSAEGETIPLATISSYYDDGVVFSCDGQLLACLFTPPKQRKPHVRVYNIQKQTYEMDIVSPTPFIGTGKSQPLTFSPDSVFLAAADLQGTLFFWDIRKQQLTATIQAHPDPGNLPYAGISAVAWSPVDHYLVTGGWETTDPSFSGERFIIKLWEINYIL